jgi:hypothetical protein
MIRTERAIAQWSELSTTKGGISEHLGADIAGQVQRPDRQNRSIFTELVAG